LRDILIQLGRSYCENCYWAGAKTGGVNVRFNSRPKQCDCCDDESATSNCFRFVPRITTLLHSNKIVMDILFMPGRFLINVINNS